MAEDMNTNVNEKENISSTATTNGEVWRDRKRLWCGLPWTFTVYRLSTDRLFLKTGMLNIKEDEVRLYRIKDVSLSRSFIQRIFGLGTIHVSSSDSNLKDFDIKNIKKSSEIKEKISQLVEEERNRKRVTSREYMNMDSENDADDEAL